VTPRGQRSGGGVAGSRQERTHPAAEATGYVRSERIQPRRRRRNRGGNESTREVDKDAAERTNPTPEAAGSRREGTNPTVKQRGCRPMRTDPAVKELDSERSKRNPAGQRRHSGRSSDIHGPRRDATARAAISGHRATDAPIGATISEPRAPESRPRATISGPEASDFAPKRRTSGTGQPIRRPEPADPHPSDRVSPNAAIQSRPPSSPAARQPAATRRGGSSIGSSVRRKVPQWMPSMSGRGASGCGAITS
jgi:hypothetical protein